jgi:plasmid stabilization system protein ParE
MLGRFPRRGRIVPEVGRPEIREIIHRSHRVVYRHSPRLVEVLTVRHGRRLFAAEVVGPE